MSRLVFLCLGWSCVGLGVAGAFLPVLPTTGFLILAAAAFSRGSPRARMWLLEHRIFGPGLRKWEEEGAIPRPAKILAVGMMTLVFLACIWLRLPAWVLVMQAAIMSVGAAYVLTRPDGA